MKRTLATLVALLLPLATAAAPAVATLRDRDDRKIGTATFKAVPGGVQVTVQVKGLAKGPHGLHLHAVGRCEGPDFRTAGGHFDPTGKQHGIGTPGGPHVGDLPNLVAAADGRATLTATLEGATLALAGPGSILGGAGTALVIEEQWDDMSPEKRIKPPERIACGVVQSRR